ncbi:GSCFA domain-containing protein [Pontibacter sp. H249]|uniref:GSCFA domain-containing protein n=1 Tax=Pontibacter sp. H249 TaxID=3133420 RepID=UPI0030BB2EB3
MFRTEITVQKTGLGLALQDKVVTLGSCFAEVIGTKLKQNKVDVLANPFGTIFNPISVCRLIQAAIQQSHTFEQQLVQHNGIWYAYDLHSSISAVSKEQLLELIDERLKNTASYLQNASLLIITLGTAIAYELVETGNIVANCHKLPAKNFKRALLQLDSTSLYFQQTLDQLKSINPKLKVLFTVSPVRHLKETLTMNSVSKAQLRLLSHYMQEANQEVLYFPAYEIMMDDLRDYRYYKDDMLHPTTLAEDYIWGKFIKAYYNEPFQKFVVEWEKIKRALAHKPFHPKSEGHQAFLGNTVKQLEEISHIYGISVKEEQHMLQEQMTSR